MAPNTGAPTSWTLNHRCLLSRLPPKNLARNTGERAASTSLCASNLLVPTANVTSARRPLPSSAASHRVVSGGAGAATKQ